MEEEDNKTILIYDFGGGTFDVSFLEIKDGNIEIIETDGDNNLGGKDITNKLKEFVFDKILDEHDELDMFDKQSSNLSQKDYDINLSKITNEAERVKIELSEYEEVTFSLQILLILMVVVLI